MTTQEALKRVCALAREKADPKRIETARRRQAAIFEWQEADYIPITFGVDVPELKELPAYDWREQFFDPAKSFVEQMKGAVRTLASGSDSISSLRADTGVVNGPALFGARIDVPTHTKPVVTQYVPKEKLRGFVLPDDLRGLGTVDRVIEHMQHHAAALEAHGLRGLVSLHHCDTQGPFDIAEQTRGHDLFTDFFEDPEFVHGLMEQSTRAYIGLSVLSKRLAGDGPARGSASGCWMEKGGVRMCDDSGILLSAKVYDEFVLPYMARGLAHFGGGWLHYCGGVPGGGRVEGLHIHPSYFRIPHLKALNFTTGHDWAGEVKKALDHKIAYVGSIPRKPEEDLETYFTRVLSLCPGRKGLLFGCGFKSDAERATAIDTWHRLQDKLFAKKASRARKAKA
jgi:hypothetical protein